MRSTECRSSFVSASCDDVPVEMTPVLQVHAGGAATDGLVSDGRTTGAESHSSTS